MKLRDLYFEDNSILDESVPSLVAAVRDRNTGKLYAGKSGQAHWDVAKDNGFAGVNWKDRDNIETGFLNHKGHFLTRERALAYAVQHDLVHDNAIRYLSSPEVPAELGASFLKKD